MYYNNLYSKDYKSDYEDLAITVYIIPKLEDWEIISYPETYLKYLGANADVIQKGSLVKIIPTAPATSDWIAIISDIDTDIPEINVYITEYTNSRISVGSNSLDKIINNLYRQAKKEYAELKKSEIRLYRYKKGNMWISQVHPTGEFKYEYCRLTSCLLDKSFETPKENGYFFGIVKKTIVDKRKKLVDIVSPISVYINDDPYDILNNPLSFELESLEDGLLNILRSMVELRLDNTFFRILYHYAKKDEELMELYKEAILNDDSSSIFENELVVNMLKDYKKDVKCALKNSVDEISAIYNIISTKQPLDNVPFHLSPLEFEKKSKLKGNDKILIAYENCEYDLKEVSSIDTTLCNNYDIKKDENDLYYLVEKR